MNDLISQIASHHRRGVASAALAVTGVALAAGNHVAIKAPKTAKKGKKFGFTVTINSASNGNYEALYFITGLKCPKTFMRELIYGRSSPTQATNVSSGQVPKGKSTLSYRHTATAVGKDYICAYLHEGGLTAKTLASASSRFVTHG